MNLSIDIGNSFLKFTLFQHNNIVEQYRLEKGETEQIEQIFNRHSNIKNAIMLSSSNRDEKLENLIKQRVKNFLFFDSNTKVPIKNLYQTPHTLGTDRLAAAVGAKELFDKRNVLVIDFGTAITIDMLSEKGEFLGGNISLGLKSRYRALNDYTFSLPLCCEPKEIFSPAQNTTQAIESGVILSVIYEIEGYIRDYSKKFQDLVIIFTGGDAQIFENRFKSCIFVRYDLVPLGLNRILEYNAN